MAVEAIHSFLVTPSKHAEKPPDIAGTNLPLKGKLYEMLLGVYDKADDECRIDIAFNHDRSGKQQNGARDLLLKYIGVRSLDGGREIATRLQGVTDKRAGLGLLFLMAGKADGKHKVLVSRFPADEGIVAEQKKESLSVEFIEHVFLKSATSYKAALYYGTNLQSGFWDGRCVDKQVNSDMVSISDYWIKHFLASDFKTTPAQGTRRVAKAIKAAIKETPDLKAKEELMAMGRLASGSHGKSVSAESLAKQFALSLTAEHTLKQQFPEKLYQEKFRMDGSEYSKHIAFQSIELDNGGILTAEAPKFDQVFQREELGDKTRFSTEGQIVDERIRTTKL